jgi:type IV secretory pathway protease TraF
VTHAYRFAVTLIAITAALFLALASLSVLHVAGNLSPSVPRGFYRITHDPLQRGIYVILKMPLKRVAALPGDTVRVTAEGSYVNGKFWPGSAIPADVLVTHRLEHYPFGVYVLKSGQLWVLSNNPRGWDSRYFGPIDQQLVSSTARPLFTEKAK